MKSTLTRCLVVVACCWSVSASAQSDPSEPTARPSDSGECAVDADCPSTFTCVTDDFESCAPCPDDGSDCTSTCSGGSYSYCMPPPPTPCSADSDCSGADVCVSYTYEACSGSGTSVACVEGEPCEIPPVMEEEPSCETQTEAYCVPRYVAPCQAAADCGPGFTCEAIEQCACSSGGAVEPNNSSDPEPMPVDDCVCEPSGENYCQVIMVECHTDADCAQDLECISGPSYDTPVSVDPDGNGDVSPSSDPASVSYCLPTGYGYWGETNGGDVVAQESGVNGDLSTSDRISWGTNPADGGSGSKDSSATCSTIEGDAALSLLGLFGLVGWFRRRR